jgi:hypothetical protein
MDDADPMVVDLEYIVTPVPLDNGEDDMYIEKSVVLTSMCVKTAIAQDGAEAAGLETIGAASGTQEASSASAECSDRVLSETVVPTTAVEFTEQVARIQRLVGVTAPPVSGTGDPIDEVDPSQVLAADPDERIPRPGERSCNRSSDSENEEEI